MNTSPDISVEARLGKPLRRESLSQAIANRLQEMIGLRSIAPGDRLPPERELAQMLDVSRSAIREAIRILEGLGIVTVRHGKGVYVCERQLPPLTDLSQLDSVDRLFLLRQATDARRSIDVETARVAALNATDADLAAIEAYLAAADQEPLWSKRQYSLDLGFEALLGQATHNAYLMALQRLAHQMFQAAWESAGVMPRPASMRSEQHREIFAAVRARDADGAAGLMQRHFKLAIS